MAGADPPPLARQELADRWSFTDDADVVEETNVVELADFVARVNRSM